MQRFLMARRWKSCCLKLAVLGVLLTCEVVWRQGFFNAPVHTENHPLPTTAENPQLPSHIDVHAQLPTNTDNHTHLPNNTEKHPQPPPHTNLTDHPQRPTSLKIPPQPPIHAKNQAGPPMNAEQLARRRQEMDRQMREYPLSVNLSDVVDRILNGESPQVKPVHNTTRYAYTINPVHTCRNSTVTDGQESSIFLLVLVKSKFNHFQNRDVIRRTWGNESLAMGLAKTRLKTVFLLGNVPATLPGRSNIRDRLKAESLQHEDLVQQDFLDAYFNNTLKMKMGYHWALTYCPSAEFLAFLDDDYFVDTPNLIKALQTNISHSEYSHVVAGFVLRYDSVKRHRSSKWYVSPTEYRYNTYPPFAIAGSVFLHRCAARRLFTGMRFTKPFRLDDVYLAINAWKLGIEMRHWPGVHHSPVKYGAEAYRDVVAIHGYGDMTAVLRLWEMKYG